MAGKSVVDGITEAFIFDTQHRMQRDEDGQRLQHYCEPFKRPLPSREEVIEVCEALQATTPTNFATVLKECPKVMVLRHAVRQKINRYLAINHANQGFETPRRIVLWRSYDIMTTVDRLQVPLRDFPALNNALADVPAKKTEGIEGWCYFFEGIEYVFIDSENPEVGRSRNSWATGVKLVVDENEEDDDLTRPYRVLKYPPKAIVVRPHDIHVGRACCDEHGLVPEGCIVVQAITTKAFNVTLPDAVTISTQDGHTSLKTFKVKRRGIPLGDGYAVTDYFVQGMTFGNNPWLLHLVPPTDGRKNDDEGTLTRASILVAMSRYPLWSKVRLLAPLWTNPQEKAAVLDMFVKAATMGPDLIAFLERLRDLGAATARKHHQLATTLLPAVELANTARQRAAQSAQHNNGMQQIHVGVKEVMWLVTAPSRCKLLACRATHLYTL